LFKDKGSFSKVLSNDFIIMRQIMRYPILTLMMALLISIPELCLAELTDNTVVDVVVEVDLDNDILQVGDYNLEVPSEVDSCSTVVEGAENTTTTASELTAGTVVQFEPVSKDDNGVWAVNNLTILTGNCLTQKLSELEEEEQLRINNTVAAMGGTTDTDTADESSTASASTTTNSSTATTTTADSGTTTSTSSSQTLHFENGVWKN